MKYTLSRLKIGPSFSSVSFSFTLGISFRSPWKARECFQDRPYSKESDVWAFGVVLWEMFSKLKPFQNMTDDMVIKLSLMLFDFLKTVQLGGLKFCSVNTECTGGGQNRVHP